MSSVSIEGTDKTKIGIASRIAAKLVVLLTTEIEIAINEYPSIEEDLGKMKYLALTMLMIECAKMDGYNKKRNPSADDFTLQLVDGILQIWPMMDEGKWGTDKFLPEIKRTPFWELMRNYYDTMGLGEDILTKLSRERNS